VSEPVTLIVPDRLELEPPVELLVLGVVLLEQPVKPSAPIARIATTATAIHFLSFT